MPALLTQVQEALGLSAASVPAAIAKPSVPVTASIPVALSSRSAAPPILSSSSAPPIVAEDSDSEDQNIQTLAVPFRSGNSDTYLPMISVDDSWHSDAEFRFVYSFLISKFRDAGAVFKLLNVAEINLQNKIRSINQFSSGRLGKLSGE